jgi:hypothetical protein
MKIPTIEQILQKIDLTSLSESIEEAEYRNYFLGECGQEHYRLLAYISTLYSNTTLIDIGTFKGCSALSLSYNSSNIVHSFDISFNKTIQNIPSNIHFYIDDVFDIKFKQLILSSPFIMVDTAHDGIFEKQFHEFLQLNNWKGILLLDDIHLNDAMKEYWDSIRENKLDISHLGHWSGTGIVYFGAQ